MCTKAKQYEMFFRLTPVLTQAAQELDVEDAMDFMRQVYKLKWDGLGHSLGYSPSWYLFEEIGWPEGSGYCYDGTFGIGNEQATVNVRLLLERLKEQNDSIAPRLELRRKHWKVPEKWQFVEAHSRLLEVLESVKNKDFGKEN